tara:strand:+ start:34018 stop:35457 length:1440 start_codon:yes stop_codon:yes gene_type:complete
MTLGKAIENKYRSFFYDGPDSRDIAFARIFFYSSLIYLYFSDDYLIRYLYLPEIPTTLWRPISFFQGISHDGLMQLCSPLMVTLFGVSLLFSALGLLFPLMSFLAFLSGLFIIGMPNNIGTVYDSTTLVCVVLGILPFTHASHSLSLDRHFGIKFKFNRLLNRSILERDHSVEQDHLSSVWGLNLIASLVFLYFLCSAIQKMRLGGLRWPMSQDFAMALIYNQVELGKALSQEFELHFILKVMTLVLQFCAFVPLFWKKYRVFYTFLLLGFHLGVDSLMGVHFSTFKIIYFFIFPWTQFLRDLKKSVPFIPIFTRGKSLLMDPPNPWAESSWPLRRSSQILHLSLLIFVLGGSLASVYTYKHFWPFSTATMYAYPETFPYNEINFYIGDHAQQMTLVQDPDFFPLDRVRTQLAVRKLYFKDQVSLFSLGFAVTQMLTKAKKKPFKRLEIRQCYYPNIGALKENYPYSEDCKLLQKIENH